MCIETITTISAHSDTGVVLLVDILNSYNSIGEHMSLWQYNIIIEICWKDTSIPNNTMQITAASVGNRDYQLVQFPWIIDYPSSRKSPSNYCHISGIKIFSQITLLVVPFLRSCPSTSCGSKSSDFGGSCGLFQIQHVM